MLRRLARRIGTGRAVLLLRIAQLPLRLLLAVLERLVPIDHQLVLFGSPRDRFADNAAYGFLAATMRERPFRSVWLTGSRETARRLTRAGLPVLLRWSPAGVWACMRARAYVVSSYRSDINLWLGSRSMLVNLWHGVPLKRIERDLNDGPLALLHRPRARRSVLALALAVDSRPPDRLLSSSQYVSERCMVSAFGVSPRQIWNIGLPRNDQLASPTPELRSSALVTDEARWRKLAAGLTVGYFPTWRDDGSNPLALGGLRLEEMARWVAAQGGVLLFKPHYNDLGLATAADPNLVVLDQDDDVHAYLPVCDVLITDYSSIGIDFLLTGRPIIYFVPDLATYRAMRGFYFDPASLMPGPMVATAQQLREVLRSLDPGAVPTPEYLEVRNRLWADNTQGRSGEYFADLLKQLLSTPATGAPEKPHVDDVGLEALLPTRTAG